MVRSKAQAETDLKAALPLIGDAVRAALREYATDYKTLRHRHSRRTRASIIADLMQEQVAQRFENVPKVRVLRKATAINLGLYGKYVIRMKKLNSAKQVASTGTFAATRFAQQKQLTFGAPFPQAATNLYAGYVLNELQVTESLVYVVCPAGGRDQHWDLLIPERPAEIVPIRAPTAANESQPSEEKRTSRARKKPVLSVVKTDTEK